METLKEAASDALIFIAAFIISMGSCPNKAVKCGAEEVQAVAK